MALEQVFVPCILHSCLIDQTLHTMTTIRHKAVSINTVHKLPGWSEITVKPRKKNHTLSSSFNSIFLFGWRKNDKISLFPPSRLCFFLLWPQILFDWENDSWKIYVSQKFLTIICKRHRLFFLHSKKYWQGAALIRGMRLYGTFKPPRNLLSAFLPLVNYILLLASQLTLVNYVSWR